jgi:hypothetical protein
MRLPKLLWIILLEMEILKMLSRKIGVKCLLKMGVNDLHNSFLLNIDFACKQFVPDCSQFTVINSCRGRWTVAVELFTNWYFRSNYFSI